jgi:hypothetical protein
MKALLLANCSTASGTRTYFKQLIGFYFEKGVSCALLALESENEEDMEGFCNELGIQCIRLRD